MHAALGSTLKPHKLSVLVVKGEVGDQKCNSILSSEVNLRPARATMTPCFRKRNNIKETNFHIIQVVNFPRCNKFLGIEFRRGFASAHSSRCLSPPRVQSMVRQTPWQEEEPSRAARMVAAGKRKDRKGLEVAHFLYNITIL